MANGRTLAIMVTRMNFFSYLGLPYNVRFPSSCIHEIARIPFRRAKARKLHSKIFECPEQNYFPWSKFKLLEASDLFFINS
eukprot:snap_masked-scaffold_58-processed-gene-0.37-mRNA-1 protein AED:1.00 eAED:1.00 QI:0/-1/0/0/-1/1/1/0/80